MVSGHLKSPLFLKKNKTNLKKRGTFVVFLRKQQYTYFIKFKFNMKNIFSILFFSIFLSLTLSAQTDVDYNNSLRKMFETSGTEKMYKLVVENMLLSYKENLLLDMDDDIFKSLEAECLNMSLDVLVEMYAPVYKKYMSKQDLDELTKFYLSPIGQKVVNNTPMIMEEAMEIGKQWGMQIGEKIEKKIRESRGK
jgi:hypothetical protein